MKEEVHDWQLWKPDFKELRRLAKDRPALLKAIDEYEKLWTFTKEKNDLMFVLGTSGLDPIR